VCLCSVLCVLCYCIVCLCSVLCVLCSVLCVCVLYCVYVVYCVFCATVLCVCVLYCVCLCSVLCVCVLYCVCLCCVLCVCVLYCVFVFCIVCSVLLYFLCIVSSFVYSCLSRIFVQVYQPLPPGGNPVAVNKYRIVKKSKINILHLQCTYYVTPHHTLSPPNVDSPSTSANNFSRYQLQGRKY
jgi:hypothetical protein